jgi:hypothetical protein
MRLQKTSGYNSLFACMVTKRPTSYKSHRLQQVSTFYRFAGMQRFLKANAAEAEAQRLGEDDDEFVVRF